jgi:hypothetical protein
MRLLTDHTNSFVVRIWQEPREIVDELPDWRGWVEHVQSGERTYFRDMEESAAFIASHVDRDTQRSLRLKRVSDELWKWVSRLGWLTAL